MSDSEQTSEDSGSFKLLFLAVLIDLLGFGIIIPILPFIVKDINPVQEGILLAVLLSAYSLAQFIASPLWGRLSDRIGRRPVILSGLFGSFLSFSMFALVRSYNLILISRVIQGLFTGATLPTARAYIADITPKADRAKRYGLLGAAFGIGFTFGPAIGSLLSLKIFLIPTLPAHAAAGFFAAFLCLMNFLYARKSLPESLSDDMKEEAELRREVQPNMLQSINELVNFPQVGVLLAIFLLTTLTFSSFESFLPLYANMIDKLITQDNIGYFFAVIGIMVAVIQGGMVGPVVDRLGEDMTILVSLGLEVLGFFLLAIANSLLGLIITIIPLAIGTALLNPSINSAISNRIPQDKQGSGMGINSSVGSLGRVIGPVFGGILWDIAPRSVFYVGAGVLLVILFFSVMPLGRSQPVQNDNVQYPQADIEQVAD